MTLQHTLTAPARSPTRRAPYKMADSEVQERRNRAVLQSIWLAEWIIAPSHTLGDHRIEAQTFGPFAVHLTIMPEGHFGTRYVLTHLPTGLRLATFAQERRAKRAAHALMELADWWFTDEGAKAHGIIAVRQEDIEAVIMVLGGAL